jgi:hypothetical protein
MILSPVRSPRQLPAKRWTSLKQYPPDRIADADPDDGRADLVVRLQEDEILILCHDASVQVSGMPPYGAVRRVRKANIASMPRAHRHEPLRQCRRQIGVDEEPHGPAAVKTG